MVIMLEVRLSNPGACTPVTCQAYLPPASLSQLTDAPCSSSPISLYSLEGPVTLGKAAQCVEHSIPLLVSFQQLSLELLISSFSL